MVESVLARLQEDDCKALPITRNGELAGILTTENLGEYMMIQAALGGGTRDQEADSRPPAARRANWAS